MNPSTPPRYIRSGSYARIIRYRALTKHVFPRYQEMIAAADRPDLLGAP